MIVAGIMGILLTILKYILSPLPDIPHIAAGIMASATAVTSSLGNSVQVLAFVLSPELITAIAVITLAVINFHWAYALFMWTIRKIPSLGIH